MVAGNFFSVHLCLFNTCQWNYLSGAWKRETLSTLTKLWDSKISKFNADENILDWVIALALKSGCVSYNGVNAAASDLCFSLAGSEMR